jgi:hypothetical protein
MPISAYLPTAGNSRILQFRRVVLPSLSRETRFTCYFCPSPRKGKISLGGVIPYLQTIDL